MITKNLFAGIFPALLSIFLTLPEKSYAMHIMEGYLPPSLCIAWGIISLPFIVAGFFKIRKILQEDRKNITLIAMAGAFIFVISSIGNLLIFVIGSFTFLPSMTYTPLPYQADDFWKCVGLSSKIIEIRAFSSGKTGRISVEIYLPWFPHEGHTFSKIGILHSSHQ